MTDSSAGVIRSETPQSLYIRFQVKRGQLTGIYGLSPGRQGPSMILTVLYVPYSLDSISIVPLSSEYSTYKTSEYSTLNVRGWGVGLKHPETLERRRAQPSTLNPRPSILNPQLSTLNPKLEESCSLNVRPHKNQDGTQTKPNTQDSLRDPSN